MSENLKSLDQFINGAPFFAIEVTERGWLKCTFYIQDWRGVHFWAGLRLFPILAYRAWKLIWLGLPRMKPPEGGAR